MALTLTERVEELSQLQPDKEALIHKDVSLTYVRLFEKVCATTQHLREADVAPGDRVLYSALSTPETAIALLAIQNCGGVAVALDKNASIQTVNDLYGFCEAKLLLIDRNAEELAASCTVRSLNELSSLATSEGPCYRHQPDKEDIAEMLFTTGTTGNAKGVMLSYRAVQAIWENTIAGTGLCADDRILLPLPLNHSVALRVLRAALSIGATVVLQNGFTFARNIEENIVKHNCTALVAVPASIETMRAQMQGRFAEVMKRLRSLEVGAGSLSPSERTRLAEELPHTRITNTWGSSETGGALFVDVREAVQDPSGALLHATGKAVPGVEVRLKQHEGPEGSGKLALRGSMTMSGYWQQEDLTAHTLVDGWVVTNDLAYIEDDYVFLVGRADDIINVGGRKASPVEIERVAALYDGISECACIGVDDPRGIMGQVPVLFAVARGSDYQESALRMHLAKQLDRYKQPQEIVLVESLPRNKMLKLDRLALKEQWAAMAGAEEGTIELMNETVRSIFSRKSVRSFTNEPVRKDVLDIILKAGYHAPTGKNMQTWRFTVLEERESIARLKQAALDAAAHAGAKVYGFEQPPCVVLVSNDTRNATGCQDSACAVENMMIAAASYGLGSVWINGLANLRDVEPLKTVLDDLDIPKTHAIWSTLLIGTPAAESPSPARRENVVVFADRFDQA